jgi:hypothetical protein
MEIRGDQRAAATAKGQPKRADQLGQGASK